MGLPSLLRFVIVSSVAIAIGAPSAHAVDASCYGPTIKPDIACPGEEVDVAAAVNSPDAHAWHTFAIINQPAFPGNVKDTRRVWETWKNADDNSDSQYAIYLSNGHAPSAWNVTPLAAMPAKKLVPIRQLELLRAAALKRDNASTTAIFINPDDPLAQEARTNRPAFNFILQNHLYNQQGQYMFASKNRDFDFPVPSKEIKAVWLPVTAGIDPKAYYSATVGGETYVLVAMHVITKDVTFWFWSTFVHKDQNLNPENGYVAPLASDQNVPPSLNGTPFVNYRLIGELIQSPDGRLADSGRGAQLDWIDRTGNPTVIGNPHIEAGFETRSSCITCHAHASIALLSDNTIAYNQFPLQVGAVDPANFTAKNVTYFPLDFLWSLRRAKPYRP